MHASLGPVQFTPTDLSVQQNLNASTELPILSHTCYIDMLMNFTCMTEPPPEGVEVGELFGPAMTLTMV